MCARTCGESSLRKERGEGPHHTDAAGGAENILLCDGGIGAVFKSEINHVRPTNQSVLIKLGDQPSLLQARTERVRTWDFL